METAGPSTKQQYHTFVDLVKDENTQQPYTLTPSAITNRIVMKHEAKRLAHWKHPLLQGLSHSRAHQSALGFCLALSSLILCSTFIIAAWANSLDKQHCSAGAKPSLAQQNRDQHEAVENTIKIILLSFTLFTLATAAIYYWIDRPRYLKGYRRFTYITGMPEFEAVDAATLLQDLKHHCKFLMGQPFAQGMPAIAYLLANLQEHLLDPPSKTTDHRATLPAPTEDIAPSATPPENFAQKLEHTLLRNENQYREAQENTQTTLARREIPIIFLGAKAATTAHAKESIQPAHTPPSIAKDYFLPLLVYEIREQMSEKHLTISMQHRALFLTALLREPYYQNHLENLGALLYIFFGFAHAHGNINSPFFTQEYKADVNTFSYLSEKDKITVACGLNMCGDEGIQMAAALTEKQPKACQASIAKSWSTHSITSATTRALKNEVLNKILLSHDQAATTLNTLTSQQKSYY